MINDYLLTRYKPGGRGPDVFDCWGLVRAAKVELFGGAQLPACASTLPGNIAGLTREVDHVTTACALREVEAIPGSIATAWRGKLCVHVGLVVDADGSRWILETDVESGPCLTRIAKFEQRYTRVAYYAD